MANDDSAFEETSPAVRSAQKAGASDHHVSNQMLEYKGFLIAAAGTAIRGSPPLTCSGPSETVTRSLLSMRASRKGTLQPIKPHSRPVKRLVEITSTACLSWYG